MDVLDWHRTRITASDLWLGVVVSCVVHALIVVGAFYLPFWMPHKTYRIAFTKVRLVTPGEIGLQGESLKVAPPKARHSTAVRRSAWRRVEAPPVVSVRKLHVEKSPTKVEVHKIRDRWIAKEVQPEITNIERTLDTLLDQSLAKARKRRAGLRKKASTGREVRRGRSSHVEEDEDIGLARRLYYTEVWSAVKKNWILPEGILLSKKLEAILVVTVRRDGKILAIRFERKSGNRLFDESVYRAVRKSDPFPPFPEIYSPPKDEIGIRFRPEYLR